MTSSPSLHNSIASRDTFGGSTLGFTISIPTWPVTRSYSGSIALFSLFSRRVFESKSNTAPSLLNTNLLMRHGTSGGTMDILRITTCPPQSRLNTRAFSDHILFPGPNLKGSLSSTIACGQLFSSQNLTIARAFSSPTTLFAQAVSA